MQIVAGIATAILAIAAVLGLLAIPWVISRAVARGIHAGVSAIVKGRIRESRPTQLVAASVGVLSLTCGILVLPAVYWYAAHWGHMRMPSDLTPTGYRLPPLDPADALRFSLLWAGGGLVLGIAAMALHPSGVGSRIARGGVAASLVFGGLTLLAAPPMLRPEDSAIKAVCLSNVKNIAMALQMYAQDNDDVPPNANTWCDQLDGYIKNRHVFLCDRSWGTPSAYAYNDALDRERLASLGDSASLIAIFESNTRWNAHGGPELLVKEPRHLGGDNYGFADGHAGWVSRPKPLRWTLR